MKILYIDIVSSIKNIRIAEQSIFSIELPKLGHDVYFLLKNNSIVHKQSDKLYNYNSNILSKLFFNIPLTVALFKLLNTFKFDYVISRNDLSICFMSLILAKMKGIPFVYFKTFPMTEFFFLRYRKTNNILLKVISYNRYKIHEIFEKIVLKHSEIICPRTIAYKEYLFQNKKIDNRKMYPIPMGFDSNYNGYINIDEKNSILNKLKIPKKQIVLYFGTVEKEREINFIIDILLNVNKVNNQIQFVIIGGNISDKPLILEYAKRKNIQEHLTLINNIQREMLFSYIQVADLTISPIPPIPVYLISSPTKVVESLGLGIPVIVNNEISDQNDLVLNSGGGLSVPYDEKAFSNAIIKVINDEELLKSMGEKGKTYIYKERTYRELTNGFLEFISEFNISK